MICDLAETYHIYNYRELPVSLLATLVAGLRANSRTKMAINGTKIPMETLLMASIYDRLNSWIWMNTKEGRKGQNPPKSLLQMMTTEKKEQNESFETGAEFDEAYQRIIRGG